MPWPSWCCGSSPGVSSEHGFTAASGPAAALMLVVVLVVPVASVASEVVLDGWLEPEHAPITKAAAHKAGTVKSGLFTGICPFSCSGNPAEAWRFDVVGVHRGWVAVCQ